MASDSVLSNQLSLPIISTPHWQLNGLVNDLQTERVLIDRFLMVEPVHSRLTIEFGMSAHIF